MLIFAFSIFSIINIGGIQKLESSFNAYPEEKYVQLEQSLDTILIFGKIHYELLADDIEYNINYSKSNNTEGEYVIELKKKNATITATIGEELTKESLSIEGNFKTKSDYSNVQRWSFILLILRNSLVSLVLFLLIVCGIISFISLVQLLFYKLSDKLSGSRRSSP